MYESIIIFNIILYVEKICICRYKNILNKLDIKLYIPVNSIIYFIRVLYLFSALIHSQVSSFSLFFFPFLLYGCAGHVFLPCRVKNNTPTNLPILGWHPFKWFRCLWLRPVLPDRWWCFNIS